MFQGKLRLIFKRDANDWDALAVSPCFPHSNWTRPEEVRKFGVFAKELARKIAGIKIFVHYVIAPGYVPLDGSYLLQSLDTGTVILNVGSLGENWFRDSNRQDHVEVLLYLLAQHRVQITKCDSAQDAELCFREELAHLGAAAMVMAMDLAVQAGMQSPSMSAIEGQG